MDSVIVIGGTGETGRRVVGRLVREGRVVRVLTRDAQRAREVLGHDVQLVEGDVREPASIAGITHGMQGLICAVGTRRHFSANGTQQVEAGGVRHLMGELAKSVGHVVLLSGYGLDRNSLFLRGFSWVLNGYYEAKEAAEQAVRSAGVPYTIVRPVTLSNRPATGHAVLNQSGAVGMLSTMSRDVLADVLVRSLGDPSAFGKTFELTEGVAEPLGTQLRTMKQDGLRRMPSHTPMFGVQARA